MSGLFFEWFVDGVLQGVVSSLCDFMYMFVIIGIIYKVVVIDFVIGCMDMVEQMVIFCDVN